MFSIPEFDAAVAALAVRLAAPFTAGDVRFKKGGGNQFFPYIEVDILQDRLIQVTGNQWNLEIANWEWREKTVVVYGHLEIPGLGRRGGIGVQEHTSAAGNEMGADMIKGVRADLLKNCLVAFDCGTQVRAMDPLPFDPGNPLCTDRLRNYMRHYFPEPDPPSAVARPTAASPSTTPAARPAHVAPIARLPITSGDWAADMERYAPPDRPRAAAA